LGRRLDTIANWWCLQRFQIGHTSFAREAFWVQ
jgi:hypothetical protein